MITYDQALDYIYNLTKYGIKLGLNNIRELLESLGNPQKNIKIIHVGGTNGKGSTVSTISSILQSEGYKVGLFTSPHLVDFTERIKIDNRRITRNKICELVEKIKPHVKNVEKVHDCNHPTFFEVITAMTFLYFYEEKVDFIVLEVGLGGRLDATNICEPLISVITHVDFDHMDRLGNSLEEIAKEKAGIIKQDGLVVNTHQYKEAGKVIARIAGEKKSRIISLGKEANYKIKKIDINGIIFDYFGIFENYNELYTPLLGKHQAENAALAITTIQALRYKGIDVSRRAIIKGLKNLKWEGRLEIVKKNPTILLDGAHNPSGIRVVKNALKEIFKYNKLILILAIFSDKNYSKMIEIITPMSDIVIVTMMKSQRATSSKVLAGEISHYKDKKNIFVEKDIFLAIELALKKAKKDDLICITGSLHTVGEAKEYFQKNKKEEKN